MRSQFAMPARRIAVAAIAAASALAFRPTPSAPQTPANADRPGSLGARTRAFLKAVDAENPQAVMAFFPSSGEFTYVHTTHRRQGNRVGVWRFPASDKLKAVEYQAPLWEVFEFLVEGQTLGLFRFQVMARGTSWRRAYGTRFVPPGAPASSAAFVEWRREDGQWVVSSFGDESFNDLPLPAWMDLRDRDPDR